MDIDDRDTLKGLDDAYKLGLTHASEICDDTAKDITFAEYGIAAEGICMALIRCRDRILERRDSDPKAL